MLECIFIYKELIDGQSFGHGIFQGVSGERAAEGSAGRKHRRTGHSDGEHGSRHGNKEHGGRHAKPHSSRGAERSSNNRTHCGSHAGLFCIARRYLGKLLRSSAGRKNAHFNFSSGVFKPVGQRRSLFSRIQYAYNCFHISPP